MPPNPSSRRPSAAAQHYVGFMAQSMQTGQQSANKSFDKLKEGLKALKKVLDTDLGKEFLKQTGLMGRAAVGLFGTMVGGGQAAATGFRGMLAPLQQIAHTINSLGQSKIREIASHAMSGTVEARQLSVAWEYLYRVVGDNLAPYVRMLTTGVIRLAVAWRNLTPEVKAQVTHWALVGTGMATVMTIVPRLISMFTPLVRLVSMLLSPWALIIAGIAAALTAFDQFFGFAEREGENTADSLNQSNKTWIESLVNGLHWASRQIAEFLNGLTREMAKVSDWIAETWIKLYTKEGTKFREEMLGHLKAVGPVKPIFELEVRRIDEFFNRIKKRVRAAAPDLQKLADGVMHPPKPEDWQMKMPRAGFNLTQRTSFEGLQATYDRLQTALNDQYSEIEILQKILEEQKKLNEQVKKNAGAAGGVGAALMGF